MATRVSRTMMTSKGRGCMTVGDFRHLVAGLDEVPHDYEVLVSSDDELDLARITKAKVELGENRSSDGPGWVLLELTEGEG